VCRHWNVAAEDDTLWKYLVMVRWGTSGLNINWKEFAQKRIEREKMKPMHPNFIDDLSKVAKTKNSPGMESIKLGTKPSLFAASNHT